MQHRNDKDKFRANLNKYTRRAFQMIPKIEKTSILDLGCGSGTPSLELLRLCDGYVTGVDLDQTLLEAFERRSKEVGVSERVTTIQCSLHELDFVEESFDIIWCEGAISVVGFEKGLKEWKRFLKAKGFLAVHDSQKDVKQKAELISECGYDLIGQFEVPYVAWLKEYIEPLEEHLGTLESLHAEKVTTLQEFKALMSEIDSFKRNPETNASVFFVMQKRKRSHM